MRGEKKPPNAWYDGHLIKENDKSFLQTRSSNMWTNVGLRSLGMTFLNYTKLGKCLFDDEKESIF